MKKAEEGAGGLAGKLSKVNIVVVDEGSGILRMTCEREFRGGSDILAGQF